jgi:ABC-2 type transport system permease protein
MTTLATSRRPALAASHYRLADAVRMEWLKLRTVRTPRWIGLVLIASIIGTGIAVLSYYPGHWAHMSAAAKAQFDPTNTGFTGMAIAQLAVGIAGVLVITSEYSSGSIRSTLAAIPSRPLLLAAKAITFGLAALVVGELTCLAAFGIDQYVVLSAPASHASFADPTALRAVLMMGAYVALIGLLGLGIGAVVRHTAGGIALVVGVVFVVPAVFQALPATVQHSAGKYLPMMIAENSISTVKPIAYSLSPWTGMLMLCLYAAVTLAAGGWLLARRDA